MTHELAPSPGFDGGEIVRLKRDAPDYGLVAGDCGLLWGVYGLEEPVYEASFIDARGEWVDMDFYAHDVDEVPLDTSPHRERFVALKESLSSFEEHLARQQERSGG